MCKQQDCVFCNLIVDSPENVILESKHSYSVFDIKPVTKGHALVITKKHFENFAETEDEHLQDVVILAKKVVDLLKNKYPEIKGFNYISNQGKSAKQEIFHFHLHIIPRY